MRAAVLLSAGISVGACFAQGAETTAASRITAGWEYDDNVLEQSSGKTDGGAGTVSLFSRVRHLGSGDRSLNSQLDFQVGYKAHHRLADSASLTAGDVLVNRVGIGASKRLSRLWTAGLSGELKNRSIFRRNDLNLLSEEGYTRGSARFSASRSLDPSTSLTLGYRYSFINYENYHSFNFRSHSPRIGLSRKFGLRLRGSVQYSVTRRSYRRPVSAPSVPEGLVQLDRRQRDNLHQCDLALTYGRGFVLNFIYTLQRNSSNNFGFSYWNNRLSLVFGKRLPGELFLNAYLFFELRRYSDKTDEPIMVDVITEENDNNGGVLKLSRALAPGLEASLTFSHYRNQSSIRDLNFHKNLLNFALTHRF
ncbi:MAG: hypothetical protein U9P14_00310 [Gemmatimonadota bacterium]|nr:hypothetical protein [Gemmatimonadota bacterium]